MWLSAVLSAGTENQPGVKGLAKIGPKFCGFQKHWRGGRQKAAFTKLKLLCFLNENIHKNTRKRKMVRVLFLSLMISILTK